MPNVNPSPIYRKLANCFVGLTITEGLLVLVWVVSIPSDPKNVLVFGLSLQRILLLTGITLGIVGIATAFLVLTRNKRMSERIYRWLETKNFQRITTIIGFVLLIILLVPLAEWGRFAASFERIRPLIAWIALASLQLALLPIIAGGQLFRGILEWFSRRVGPIKRTLLVSMILLITTYLLSIILYPQGKNEDFWYETGVPILAWQLLLSGFLGFLFFGIEKRIVDKVGRRTNILIFFSIFIVSAILWGGSPLLPSYFNPGPFSPNYVFYPYSDAAKFDLQAQSSLLGLGLNNGLPLDRPFYPLFLAILHLLSGQSYATNMLMQAAVYGVFPAIVFLIGAELGSRSWGVVAALAISFWGLNTIQAGTWLNTATQKQMLTDFPLAVLLSLVLYLSIKWQKQVSKRMLYACIIGGLIALSAFIRYAALALLPIWMMIAVILNKRTIKKGLIEAALILASFLIFITPWYTRNLLVGQSVTLPFSNKILFVINSRYQPNDIVAPTKKSQVETTQAVFPGESTPITHSTDQVVNPPAVAIESSPSLKPGFFVVTHLVHNVMSSVMILPTLLEMASLRTTLKIGGDIWSPLWDGALSPFRTILLLIQFFILSAGIAGIRTKDKTAAAFIVLLFFVIHTANAFGRTSGGRYIVPVDWVVIPVYVAGFFSLTNRWGEGESYNSENSIIKKYALKKWLIVFTLIALIGALPVFFERFSQAFITYEKAELSFDEMNTLLGDGMSEDEFRDMNQSLSKKSIRLLEGNAFFPEQASKNKLDIIPRFIEKIDQDIILRFFFINPTRNLEVYFPYQGDIEIQNQDKVVMIGCVFSDSFLARDLFLIGPDSTRYFESDLRFDSCKQVGLK